MLRRIRALHERQLEELDVLTRRFAGDDPPANKNLVLEYGVAMHRSAARWCARAEADLLD